MPGPRPEYRCCACGATDATVLLEMGRLPMANAFVGPDAPDADCRTEPLTLVMCDDCRLIQIREVIPPEELFSNSPWLSGTSATVRNYAGWFARWLTDRLPPSKYPFLVDVASNDGTMLGALRDAGYRVLGVEPSSVAASVADERGIPTIRGHFDLETARKIISQHGVADVVLTRHSLGHTSDIVDHLEGVKALLKPDGRFLAEAPYALLLRDEVQYDTIFHEHVSYWTIYSLKRLLGRLGLRVAELRFVPMNGGSFLAEIACDGNTGEDHAVDELEDVLLLNHPRGWEDFGERVRRQRSELRTLLARLAAEGAKVLGYGAAAKSMIMLNYCGITPDLVQAFGDANPHKQGLFCPGVRIPIVSPEALMAQNPDYVLIGAWNLRDEIMRFFRDKLSFQGRFIIPLPIPRIL